MQRPLERSGQCNRFTLPPHIHDQPASQTETRQHVLRKLPPVSFRTVTWSSHCPPPYTSSTNGPLPPKHIGQHIIGRMYAAQALLYPAPVFHISLKSFHQDAENKTQQFTIPLSVRDTVPVTARPHCARCSRQATYKPCTKPCHTYQETPQRVHVMGYTECDCTSLVHRALL